MKEILFSQTNTHTYVRKSQTTIFHFFNSLNHGSKFSTRDIFILFLPVTVYVHSWQHTHTLQETGDRIKWRQYNRINALSSYMPRVCQCLVFHIFNQGSKRGRRNVLIRPLLHAAGVEGVIYMTLLNHEPVNLIIWFRCNWLRVWLWVRIV